MAEEHYIEIDAVQKRSTIVYRFYGLGVWKVKRGGKWEPIDGIFIPARILEVAAAQCSPKPILTERDIAWLCGGDC